MLWIFLNLCTLAGKRSTVLDCGWVRSTVLDSGLPLCMSLCSTVLDSVLGCARLCSTLAGGLNMLAGRARPCSTLVAGFGELLGANSSDICTQVPRQY